MRRAIQHTRGVLSGVLVRCAETTTTPAPQVEDDQTVEEEISDGSGGNGKGFRVILYDDDYHDVEEVASQIHKATQYPPLQCWAIMLEAHHKGRAVCYRGAREKCHRVARVLREIRLQCEVDCD
jgi:ATP-dependent Clp protease adapter protein ClpS